MAKKKTIRTIPQDRTPAAEQSADLAAFHRLQHGHGARQAVRFVLVGARRGGACQTFLERRDDISEDLARHRAQRGHALDRSGAQLVRQQ